MSRSELSFLTFFGIILAASTVTAATPPTTGNERTLSLHNEVAEVGFAQQGGALVHFSLNEDAVNPLAWEVSPSDMPKNNRAGAPFRGHFLCVGRWGGPTPGEQAAGVPHNGEAADTEWSITHHDQANRRLGMEVVGQIEKWRIERKASLSASQPVLSVQETLTNLLPVGRYTALVQHATMGGDFLRLDTIVNTNAGAGFNQALIDSSLDQHAYRWPSGFVDKNNTRIDLTRTDVPTSYVSTHVVDGEWGWATVATPSKQLLVGYVWKTAEYPWLHVWHGLKDGRPWAKGIEFGTTGLGDTFSPEKGITTTFHGRHNALFVDANGSVTRTYRCFLLRIPKEYTGTRAIHCSPERLVLELQIGSSLTTVSLETPR